MRIKTRGVPQADVLPDVVEAVIAVARGARTFQGISEAIGKGQRQGRYYRLAAELLGFIRPAGPNRSELTPRGRRLLASRDSDRDEAIRGAVLGSRLIQRVLPFLEARADQGCTRDGIERFIIEVTEPTGRTMIPRHTSTAIAWLQSIGLLSQQGDRYYVQPIPGVVAPIEYPDDEPLLPERFDLAEYQAAAQRATRQPGIMRYVVDEAQRERTQRAHEQLVDLLAARISGHGGIPRRNRYVDLAAHVLDSFYLFEVKTTTDRNILSQVRQGVAQLYEYRYRQAAPDARLVLVLQNPMPRGMAWMAKYLAQDREILPVWDGNLRTLDCSRQHREQLAFLVG